MSIDASSENRAGLRLDELAREISARATIVGDASVRVSGVRHDSRAVAAGDLFVARRGARSDGTKFVADALARGASAVLAARDSIDARAVSVPVLYVDDIADALAIAASAVYGHPSFALEVVGVTGTNGKTTVTHLVRAAVDAAIGHATCGTLGTVGHRFGDLSVAAEHTTPEADELARVMAAMLAHGATHVAMEVSSHALALRRVRAVRFRVAAFTNLTQDHLDFHATMDEYAAAKALLFTEHGPGAAVVNVDDAFGRELAMRVRAPLVRVSARVGADETVADIAPRSASITSRGIDAVLRTPDGDVRVASRLVGAHNLENLVVALGVVHALDLDVARAAAGLANEAGAPGRLERCDGPDDDVTVLVDYAHTPDALARVLDAVRAVATGRVLCVFGCGGDRDASKRAPMGRAAASRSDAAIVTNDNPRTEDPNVIAESVIEGVKSAGSNAIDSLALADGARGFLVELDRARAIDIAIGAASSGDVVVIAGKGHEDYQIVGTEKRHFDDREEAKRALAERRCGRDGTSAASPRRGPHQGECC
jgi:UDP-N-acetylmuramoyl-L-alanyl-D-glutamate--2,6-diaminopimelate ligase